MSDTQKHTKPNVPNLRFPGFSGEWESKDLGQIADVTKLAGYEFTKYVTYEDSGNIIALRGLNCKDGRLVLNDVKYIDNSDLSKLERSKLYIGDILFTYVGTVGEVAIIEENNRFYLAPNVSRIRFKKPFVPSFFKFLLGSNHFYDKVVFPLIATSSQPALSMENVRKFKMHFPSIEEQSKISAFLEIIEQRIEIQNKVIEDLRRVKKALCELFFDESEPNCRIGDIIKQVSERNKKRGLNNVLSVSNRYGFIEQSKQFEDRTVASEDTSNYKIVSLNDFAYNPARINVGSIARLKHFCTGIISPMYICFRTRESVLPEYLDSFFDTQYFSLEMGNRLEGSVRMCLSYESLCSIPIHIPSLQEQKKISSRIDILKQKLLLEERVLEILLLERQFLLSRLFV